MAIFCLKFGSGASIVIWLVIHSLCCCCLLPQKLNVAHPLYCIVGGWMQLAVNNGIIMYNCIASYGKHCTATHTIKCILFSSYGKSPAQIMIKWSLQRGFICIPKSSKEVRIKENFNLFDFEISKEDMQTLVCHTTILAVVNIHLRVHGSTKVTLF